VEVSVLCTPNIMAALTTWLFRWLKLNIMAQTELEVWLFEIFHEISYIIYIYEFNKTVHVLQSHSGSLKCVVHESPQISVIIAPSLHYRRN